MTPVARANEAGSPPKKLGQVAFVNSCAPNAQESFERGVALLHSFAFIAGEQAFRDTLDRDPTCAVATWGIATGLIGNTFSVGATPENAQRALEAIDRGRAIGAKTQRERDYIWATAVRYDCFAERSQRLRTQSLSDAYEALAERYSDDDEAQRFSALYQTVTQSPTDKTFARALKAAAILEAQFAKHPNHPGAAHYLIHSYDFPPIAQKGLPAGVLLCLIPPAARPLMRSICRRTSSRASACGGNRSAPMCARSLRRRLGEQSRRNAACHGLPGLCGTSIGARCRCRRPPSGNLLGFSTPAVVSLYARKRRSQRATQ